MSKAPTPESFGRRRFNFELATLNFELLFRERADAFGPFFEVCVFGRELQAFLVGRERLRVLLTRLVGEAEQAVYVRVVGRARGRLLKRGYRLHVVLRLKVGVAEEEVGALGRFGRCGRAFEYGRRADVLLREEERLTL